MQLSKIGKQKRDFGMLYEFILMVAVISIVSILVFQVNEDARKDLTINGTAYNATIDADTAVGKIPNSLGLLATAIIFGVVLWVILRVVPINLSGGKGTFQ